MPKISALFTVCPTIREMLGAKSLLVRSVYRWFLNTNWKYNLSCAVGQTNCISELVNEGELIFKEIMILYPIVWAFDYKTVTVTFKICRIKILGCFLKYMHNICMSSKIIEQTKIFSKMRNYQDTMSCTLCSPFKRPTSVFI